MTQTNIDYLFQAIAPAADHSPATSRSGNGSAGFDNHLSQASASVFDVIRRSDSGGTSSSYSAQDDRSRRSQYDSPTNKAASSSGDSTSSSAKSGNNAGTAAASGSESSGSSRTASSDADERADEHHDSDKTDDAEVAAAAGSVNQAATKDDTAKSAAHKSDSDANKIAKVESAAKDELHSRAQRKSAAEAAKGEGLNAGAKTAAKAIESPTDKSTSDPESASTTDAKAASAKDSKHDKRTTAANAAATDEKSSSDKPVGDGKATAGETVASESNGDKLPLANEAKGTSAAKGTSKAKEDSDSADDDSLLGGTASSHGNSRNEAATAGNKPDAAAVAANVVANIAETSKDGDATKDGSESAAKPVAAKAETAVGPLGRALRATTELTRGGRAAASEETPQVDPTRFVSRVAKAFQTATERGGTLQLRLSPPELGSLKLQLNVKDGVMSASLETENAAARRVLLDHLPDLRDRLAQQNIRIDRFDVDVRQEGNGSQTNPRGFNQNPYQQNPDQSPARRTPASPGQAPEIVTTSLPAATPQISSTEINLIV